VQIEVQVEGSPRGTVDVPEGATKRDIRRAACGLAGVWPCDPAYVVSYVPGESIDLKRVPL